MKSIASQTAPKSPVLVGAVGLIVAPVDAAVTSFLDQVFTWHQRVRDRRALDQLDSHMLHDIGLSRADVEQEVRKPFWRT